MRQQFVMIQQDHDTFLQTWPQTCGVSMVMGNRQTCLDIAFDYL